MGDDLRSERMVCVSSLEATGEGMNEIKEALIRVGADENFQGGTKGSFALLGYTGPEKVIWLKQVSKPRGQGPAKIVTFVITPEGAERLKVDDEDVFKDYEVEQFSKYDDYQKKGEEELEQGYATLGHTPSARSIMRQLPAEEKAKIAKLNGGLRMEKNRLVTEVSKWDDQSNEIIVLAKKMGMIMMDMSDFTRGTGPLKTTMDVIRGAERIAKMGQALNKLAGDIAERCPHSSTKSDLLAYLQRIALYSHQLTITSRVKADVQMISGELVVSGLDSATSLIQAAKNLMNSVILTVKTSYVASTKYPRLAVKGSIGGEKPKPIVVWKMKIPEKKPLVRREVPEEVRAKVRRGSQKRAANPIKVLSEFQNPEDETI